MNNSVLILYVQETFGDLSQMCCIQLEFICFFPLLLWKLFLNTFLNRQVCLFLKRGANQHATDEDGKDPLSIAVEAANADIVTL